METIENKMELHENFKQNFSRLNRALKYKFFLEAIFIAYAIIEDRTKAILIYNDCKEEKKEPWTLDRKIKKIEKIFKQTNTSLKLNINEDIIVNLQNWKAKRNKLVHNLLRQNISSDKLNDLAQEGIELARAYDKYCKKFKRRYQKKQIKLCQSVNQLVKKCDLKC